LFAGSALIVYPDVIKDTKDRGYHDKAGDGGPNDGSDQPRKLKRVPTVTTLNAPALESLPNPGGDMTYPLQFAPYAEKSAKRVLGQLLRQRGR
jgi:hypothetical protein